MLSKKYRLAQEKDFVRTAKSGRGVSIGELSIKWSKNCLSIPRFGIVVSLKISKKAVVRNKIKRRLRAIIYQNLKTIKPGYDIMILTKPGIKELNFWQIKERVEQLFEKGRLVK